MAWLPIVGGYQRGPWPVEIRLQQLDYSTNPGPHQAKPSSEKEKGIIGHIWIRRYTRRRFGCIEHVCAHWRGLPK